MKIENCELKIAKKGFTLIELMVAIFIFSVITAGIISVFVSSTSSYQKARAIKEVKENIEYAVSSIAKDVRMGNIPDASAYSNGIRNSKLEIKRNRGGTVCYSLDDLNFEKLSVCEDACTNCDADEFSDIVDLTGKNMKFSSTSGFYSCPSAVNAEATCPVGVTSKRRGWVEINLNITMTAGKEMEADEINVQTIVSSRDYGWEDVP